MREILKKNWSYKLLEDNEQFYLKVLCGNVALFDIVIKLNNDELGRYLTEGEAFIDKFVKEIQYSPASFLNRNVKLPD